MTTGLKTSSSDNLENAFIAGFGATGGKQTGNVLNEATVLLMNSADCQIAHGEKILDGQICAGHSNGAIDSCDGDTGGPLVVVDTNGQKRLAMGYK